METFTSLLSPLAKHINNTRLRRDKKREKKIGLSVACEKRFRMDKETDADFIFVSLRTIPHICHSFFRYLVGKKNLQFA